MSLQIVPNWRCHDRFYFSDGSLHLLVEDSLYCVHRSLFEKHANRFPVYGKDASFGDPYTLKDVKQIDFDRLLACLYPHALFVTEAKTSEEWTSILKLASKWGFESLRSRAVRKVKRTLNTPVDMVAFGRQYDIPDILLPGYAILCQSNVPLTYEDGLQLDMKDVVDIYRIRHELHGSDITDVSFEEATAKVKAFISNEGRKDDAEAGTVEQRDADLDDDQASVCNNVGSVSSSWVPSAGNDRELEAAVSMADIDLPPSGEAATTVGVEELGDSESEHRLPNAPSPASDASGRHDDIQLTLEDVLNTPGSTSQDLMMKFLDVLTIDNFDAVSVKILQGVNDNNDSQILYHVTRLIVEKVVKNHGQTDVCVRLCKEMVKRLSGHAIQGSITKKSKPTVFTGVSLFREYLGEVCQEKLEDVSASVTAARMSCDEIKLGSLQDGAPLPEVRRRRLIRFISKISDSTSMIITSRAIIKKWITTLLDTEDEEKLVTLSMLLDSAGPRWDASTKLKARIEKMNIAQKIDNTSRSLQRKDDYLEQLKTYPKKQDCDRGRSRSRTKPLPPNSRRREERVRNKSPGLRPSLNRSRSVTRRRQKSHSSLRSRSRDEKESRRDRSASSSSRDKRRRRRGKRDKERKRGRSKDEHREERRRRRKENKDKHRLRTQLQDVVTRRNEGRVLNETIQEENEEPLDNEGKVTGTREGRAMLRHRISAPTVVAPPTVVNRHHVAVSEPENTKAATAPHPNSPAKQSLSSSRSSNMPSLSDASGSEGDGTQWILFDLIAKFLDELIMDNFDVVSVKTLRWVNDNNDSQTLYHVTRLIVEKAVKNPGQTDICVRLCKKMVKKVSGKIRDTVTKDSKSTIIWGGSLFREYLGVVCQKELEGVTVSITAALPRSLGTFRQAHVRRLRLIGFIKQLSDLTPESEVSEIITSRAIVEKWITTLLDAKDAEKLVTLSMLLHSAGPRWDASMKKLKDRMNSCFVEMTNIARTTDNARLRALLQDVIERRNKGWDVNETAQQRRELADGTRASCSELANEQPKVEIVKTSKGGGKRSGKRSMMLASSDEESRDDEKDRSAGNGFLSALKCHIQ